MDEELNDLHMLSTSVFTNIGGITPSIKGLVASAKSFHKSYQGTIVLGTQFIQSLDTFAQAALCAKGATQSIGETLNDIINIFCEIEAMKGDLMNLFAKEVIAPLESRAEQEVNMSKLAHKQYLQDNKIQTEVVSKYTQEIVKLRKKSQRRKGKAGKYEKREEEMLGELQNSEKRLRELRENGLRRALIGERRIFCFVAEKICRFGKGMAANSKRIETMLTEKINVWDKVVSRPDDLPKESENVITNPSSYNTATMKRKSQGQTFGNQVRYHTIDGRVTSSRPSVIGKEAIEESPATNESRKPVIDVPPAPLINGAPTAAINDAPRPVIDAAPKPVINKTLAHVINEAPKPVINEAPKPVINENPAPVMNGVPLPVINKAPILDLEDGEGKKQKQIVPPPVWPKKNTKLTNGNVRYSMIGDQLQQNDLAPEKEANAQLKALYNHTGKDNSQLSFSKGDLLDPISEPAGGWQYGANKKTGKTGWFPAAYVETVYTNPIPSPKIPVIHGSLHERSSPRIRRFSTPATAQVPYIPAPDYDFNDAKVETPVGTPNDTPVGTPNCTPVGTPNGDIGVHLPIHQSMSAPGAIDTQTATVTFADEAPTIIPPPEFGETTSLASEMSLQSDYISMPFPPPPPDVDFSASEDINDNPFAGVKLKKTITNDRSMPVITSSN